MTDSYRFQADGLRGVARDGCAKQDLLELLHSVETELRPGNDSRHTRPRKKRIVKALLRIDGHPTPVCVKHFDQRYHCCSFLVNLVEPSKAAKTWNTTSGLLKRGVPIPHPIAAIDKRRFGILESSVVISEWLTDFVSLEAFFKGTLAGRLTNEKLEIKNLLIRELAKLIKSLHDRFIFHSDLTWHNIFIKQESRIGAIQLKLIDWDHAVLKTDDSLRRRILDLAQLDYSFSVVSSKTDKALFFEEYARGDQRLLSDRKRILRKIQSLTLKKTRQAVKKKNKRAAAMFKEIETRLKAKNTST